MSATYTKLRDGNWGVKTTQKPTAGQAITVTKKSGETKTERVRAILWTGADGVSICAIHQDSPASGSRTRMDNDQRGYCDECGERLIRGTKCWETGMRH